MAVNPNDIETALYAETVSIQALKDLDVKVFGDVAPDNVALPYITMGIIADPETLHMKGTSAIANTQFQIDIWASTGVERFNVFEAFRNGIHKLNELMQGVFVQVVRMTSSDNNAERKDDSSQRFNYRKRIDLEIWWRRSSPTV